MPREYSPYVITQLRGCLVAARNHREAQFEAWIEIGKCSKPFHTGTIKPPYFPNHPDEQSAVRRHSITFRAILAASSQRAGPSGLGSYWHDVEEFTYDVQAQLLPKLRECGQVHRWNTPISRDACTDKRDEGNPCTLAIANAYQQGWAKTIFQHHRLEAVRYQAHQDTMGEVKKIGISRDATRALIKAITGVTKIEDLGVVPDSDQGMVDLYWEVMLANGIEGRMTLHKAMLSYMTENYLKSSKVSLGNWIEHKGY